MKMFKRTYQHILSRKVKGTISRSHYLFENKRSNGHRTWYFQKMWRFSMRRQFSGYRAKGGVYG